MTTVIHSLNLVTKQTKIICTNDGFFFGYSISPYEIRMLYSTMRNNVSCIYLLDIKTGVEKVLFGKQ